MLLLPIIGVLFVIITMSVVIQIVSFQTTGKTGLPDGRRCSTTSSWPAGARSTSWSGSGSSPGIGVALGLGLFYTRLPAGDGVQLTWIAGAYDGPASVLVAGAGVAGAACAEVLLRPGRPGDRASTGGDAERRARCARPGAAVVVGDEPPAGLLDRRRRPGRLARASRRTTRWSRAALAAGHRPVYSRAGAGLAAARPGRAALARGHRHQRQDHHDHDARRDPARGRAAHRGAGQHRRAAGRRRLDPAGYDVLAVELSSFQLHWSSTLAPQAGALLNLADDHLDWHGGFDALRRGQDAPSGAAADRGVAVGNLDDPRGGRELLGRGAAAARSAFTLGEPPPGSVGVVDGRAGRPRPATATRIELAAVADVRPAGAHNVANALAAAALARAYGVAADGDPARAGRLRARAAPQRAVATVDGVAYVDDSKATNPHAAQASLTAYPRIVWVAGGQLKGVDIDDLVARGAPTGWPARCCSASTGPRSPTALARHAPRPAGGRGGEDR